MCVQVNKYEDIYYMYVYLQLDTKGTVYLYFDIDGTVYLKLDTKGTVYL